jgi:hypothetical protein
MALISRREIPPAGGNIERRSNGCTIAMVVRLVVSSDRVREVIDVWTMRQKINSILWFIKFSSLNVGKFG